MREELAKGKASSEETILMVIGEIYQANEKAHKLADLAIHGNQKLNRMAQIVYMILSVNILMQTWLLKELNM